VPAACGSWSGPPIALFWDQSLIWGLICRTTLRALGIPFRQLTAQEIVKGELDHHRVLLVPGGWASHKMQALGSRGQKEVRRFVLEGGSYLGFCGGAGLALASPPSLGLVPLRRLPLEKRLPSASGRVMLRKCSDHAFWRDLPEILPASIWWPSQFQWQPAPSLCCIASYAGTGSDFMTADLPVADLENRDMPWDAWEQIYGINLNPRLLIDQPAIIECRAGGGRLVLSYPHLETPGDITANQLLVNLLGYLDDAAGGCARGEPPSSAQPAGPPGDAALAFLDDAANRVDTLIQFGERHLLWKWRSPWLLHWRRGIRGLEYGSLAVLTRVLREEVRHASQAWDPGTNDPWREPARQLSQNVKVFCDLAQRLLLEEKFAGQSGHFSKVGQVNKSVDSLREQLFGRQMSHGGLCRAIFDELERLLQQALSLPQNPSHSSPDPI
jgi:hypothetical protein